MKRVEKKYDTVCLKRDYPKKIQRTQVPTLLERFNVLYGIFLFKTFSNRCRLKLLWRVQFFI